MRLLLVKLQSARAALFGLAIAAASCESRPDAQDYFGRPESRIRPAQTLRVPNLRLPHSCTDSVAETRSLVELETIVPGDLIFGDMPRDSRWSAVSIETVVSVPEGLLVLDGRRASLTLVSTHSHRALTWGTQDSALGGLQSPVALAVRPGTGEVFVLDAAPARLITFDRNGQFLRSGNLGQGSAQAIALHPNGDVYLAFPVWGKARSSKLEHQVLLAKRATDSAPPEAVVTVDTSENVPPRFVLPGPNPVRLKVSGERSAVVFEAAGVVEVFRGHERLALIHTCVPPAIAKIYQSQLDRATPETREERWVTMASDVYLEQGGDIYVVGPMQDSAGRYHIDRFGPDGSSKGSIVAPAEGVNLGRDVRFGTSPYELIGFGGSDKITVAAMRRGAR